MWEETTVLSFYSHACKPKCLESTDAHLSTLNRVFHNLSTIQEGQHCQLRLNCSAQNLIYLWSLQPWNIIPMYPSISNLTFTTISWCNQRKKLQPYGNTKLDIMPTLPSLCVCEKLELKTNTTNWHVYAGDAHELMIYNVIAFLVFHLQVTLIFQENIRPRIHTDVRKLAKYF